MAVGSSFYEKLRPMLEAGSVDWALVTMHDVKCAVAALISERQRLRQKERRNDAPLSAEEIAFMKESGLQIPLLFEGQAVKWAERSRGALFEKILKIEQRLADPTKINPYDDILLEKLREQLQKLKGRRIGKAEGVTVKPSLPSSDAFWIMSSGYRDAGDAAFKLVRSDDYTGFVVYPCVFLYFRCVELALKAVLAHHGVSENEIARTLGHRISDLLTRAESYAPVDSFGVTPEDRRLLDRYSDTYANKWFEYPDDFDASYPIVEELRELAHRMCDAIEKYERPMA
jgi:HEPN domain-containing protein